MPQRSMVGSPLSHSSIAPSAPPQPDRAAHSKQRHTGDSIAQRFALWLAAAAVVACWAFRVATIHWDSPYDIVTPRSWFPFDEGWYCKSGILLERFGAWSQPFDLTAYSHNPLWSLCVAAVLRVFGSSLVAVRLFSLACATVGLVLFHRLCRQSLPPLVAMLACLAVAGGFSDLTFVRMGLPYALGSALSLGALHSWARTSSLRGVAAGFVLAMLATTAKAFFVFTFGAILLLVLFDAHGLARRGDRAAALHRVGASVLALLAFVTLWLFIRSASGWDWTDYEREAVLQKLRVGRIAWWTVPWTEARAFTHSLSLHTGGVAFCALIVLSLVALVLRRLRATPAPTAPVTRAGRAMVLWCVLGVLEIGVSLYQPNRFFSFALPPLVFLGLTLARSLAGVWSWQRLATLVVVVHLGLQVPRYVAWIGQTSHTEQDRMARDVAARVTRGSVEATLMGSMSAHVALFDRRIRPLDSGFLEGRPYDLCDRIGHYRPRYLLRDRTDGPELTAIAARCPIVQRLVPVATYHALARFRGSPFELLELVY